MNSNEQRTAGPRAAGHFLAATVALTLLVWWGGLGSRGFAAALGTKFNVNALLAQNGVLLQGQYDLRFSLSVDDQGTTLAYGPIEFTGVLVNKGAVNVAPDFGPGAFDGTAYWLLIEVRSHPVGNQTPDPYTALTPLQPITATPYALNAPTAGKANSVASGAVGSDGVQSKAIGNSKLDDGAVDGRALGNKSVANGHLSDKAVDGRTINDKAVANGHLADAAVDSRVLGGGAVTNGHLADASVDGRTLQSGAVTADKIAAGQIVNSINGVKGDLFLSPSPDIMASIVGNTITLSLADNRVWRVNGNLGTGPGFLGTLDNMELPFRVNNVVAMRYEPTLETPNIVGGNALNRASTSGGAVPIGATIGGGGTATGPATGPQVATDDFTTVAGGAGNQAGTDNALTKDAAYATVGGGHGNLAANYAATVAGGDSNVNYGNDGTIGGGVQNKIDNTSGGADTIAGGNGNYIGSGLATIGGGSAHSIKPGADYATIPGGYSNTVSGAYALAAGNRAQAQHTGAFVWSDSGNSDFSSTANDEFSVRATGGTRLVSGFIGAGSPVGVQLLPGSGSWSTLSDRAAKTNLQPVAARAVLEHLAALPISTWSYRSQDAAVRHIGPMAQDFAAAFQVGESDTHITTVDADGVALAAIQGLNEIVQEKEARIRALEENVAELKLLVQKLGAQHQPGDKR